MYKPGLAKNSAKESHHSKNDEMSRLVRVRHLWFPYTTLVYHANAIQMRHKYYADPTNIKMPRVRRNTPNIMSIHLPRTSHAHTTHMSRACLAFSPRTPRLCQAFATRHYTYATHIPYVAICHDKTTPAPRTNHANATNTPRIRYSYAMLTSRLHHAHTTLTPRARHA